MIALICFIWSALTAPFKSKSRLEAENAALRHQLVVLQRSVRGRIEFTKGDRLFFILLYRWFPSVIKAMVIVRPETVVRWHRAGFRRYWRWKSRGRGGRPPISAELRALIRRMSVENVLWGAPRIQGELLKLGFAVAQSTVAKYMAKKDDPSGQSWSTFLRNHAQRIAAMDLFVVPTIGFVQLYVLVIVRLARRELVWINVTRHPTAEWIAQQFTEAFPWNEAPRYLIRDQDGIYGTTVRRRLRRLGAELVGNLTRAFVLVAVHISRLSCRKAGKALIFTRVRESSGESRFIPFTEIRFLLCTPCKPNPLLPFEQIRRQLQ